jgi:hypothetical protein
MEALSRQSEVVSDALDRHFRETVLIEDCVESLFAKLLLGMDRHDPSAPSSEASFTLKVGVEANLVTAQSVAEKPSLVDVGQGEVEDHVSRGRPQLLKPMAGSPKPRSDLHDVG